MSWTKGASPCETLNLKCLFMYALRYYHSSGKQSYVEIKWSCVPIASCSHKKIPIKPLRLCSKHSDLSIHQHEFPRLDTPIWDKICSYLDQEVCIQTLTKHSKRQILHWYSHQLLDVECNTFYLGHSLSNTVFLFHFTTACIPSDCRSLWSLFSNSVQILRGSLQYLLHVTFLPLLFSVNHHLILT